MIQYDSPWNQSQIGIQLGPKHIIYQKLGTFIKKKDIFVL